MKRFALIAMAATLVAGLCHGQESYEIQDPRAGEFAEIDFKQRLNEQVPLDLTFRNEQGKEIQLKELVNDKPVILNLVYYQCPMLCNLQLNGLVNSLRNVKMNPGNEFDVVAVSFDHTETHVLAAEKKATYMEAYDRSGTENGWHFLVGDEAPIKTITDTAGFGFKWDERTDQYSHKAGVLILTPEGKISRYFPGVDYNPRDMRFALVEASEGKIGNIVDKVFLLCYQYDPETGKYNVVVQKSLKVAGLATVGLMILFMGVMFRQDLNSVKEDE